MQFGNMISDFRKRSGMSQREFAKNVGISASYVCMLEKGSTGVREGVRPSPRIIEGCSMVMGIPVGQLYRVLYHDMNVDPMIHQIISRLDRLEKWQLSIIDDLIDDYLEIKRKE